jgi:N-acetylmuramoyl-L-alanine amidase
MIFHHKQEPLGKLLAECISREVAKVSELPNMGVISDGRIYNSGFAVLRNSTMPGVLCELGFINHNKDRRRMVTADFQKKVAEAIVRGIQIYLGERKPNEKP